MSCKTEVGGTDLFESMGGTPSGRFTKKLMVVKLQGPFKAFCLILYFLIFFFFKELTPVV